MVGADDLTEVEQQLLMAAAVQGLGPTTDISRANTVRIVHQVLRWRRVPQATALSRQCRWPAIVLSDRGETNSTSIVAIPPSRAHRTPQSHWRSKAIASGTRKRTIYAVMGRWIAPPTVPPRR